MSEAAASPQATTNCPSVLMAATAIGARIGPMLVADPALTLAGWAGALIIFAANVALALRRPAPAR